MEFLGISGYYRRFFPNFLTVAAPLTVLKSTKRKFVWMQESSKERKERQGEEGKAFLSLYPVLRVPDYKKSFHLFMDASGVSIGAVLLQQDSDTGILHRTSYYSARLKKWWRRPWRW